MSQKTGLLVVAAENEFGQFQITGIGFSFLISAGLSGGLADLVMKFMLKVGSVGIPIHPETSLRSAIRSLICG